MIRGTRFDARFGGANTGVTQMCTRALDYWILWRVLFDSIRCLLVRCGGRASSPSTTKGPTDPATGASTRSRPTPTSSPTALTEASSASVSPFRPNNIAANPIKLHGISRKPSRIRPNPGATFDRIRFKCGKIE